MTAVLTLTAFLVLAALGFAVARHQLRYAPRPGEIVVHPGRRVRLPNGEESIYDVFESGARWRRPYLEEFRVLRRAPVDVEVDLSDVVPAVGAALGARVSVRAELAREPLVLRNAIERFLNAHPDEVRSALTRMLESAIRDAVSAHDAVDLLAAPGAFAAELRPVVAREFARLGFDVLALDAERLREGAHPYRA